LDPTVEALVEQRLGQWLEVALRLLDLALQFHERGLAAAKINRPAVVGVDGIELPELRPPGQLRNSRSRPAQNGLGERVVYSEIRHARLKRKEVVEEGVWPRLIEERGDEAVHRLVVLRARVDPAHVGLRLAKRLVHVPLDALGKRFALGQGR